MEVHKLLSRAQCSGKSPKPRLVFEGEKTTKRMLVHSHCRALLSIFIISSLFLAVFGVRHRAQLRHRPDPGRRAHRRHRGQHRHAERSRRRVHCKDVHLGLQLHGDQVPLGRQRGEARIPRFVAHRGAVVRRRPRRDRCPSGMY